MEEEEEPLGRGVRLRLSCADRKRRPRMNTLPGRIFSNRLPSTRISHATKTRPTSRRPFPVGGGGVIVEEFFERRTRSRTQQHPTPPVRDKFGQTSVVAVHSE